jgi:hypothetical protein
VLPLDSPGPLLSPSPSPPSGAVLLDGALESVLGALLDVVGVGVAVGVGVGVALVVAEVLGVGVVLTGASDCWTTASAGLRGARWAEVVGAFGATA